MDLPKLIQNAFGIFHENLFFEVSGGHFDVILKSILKKVPNMYILLLFDVKLLLGSRTMFFKHEFCLRFSFGSIFDALASDWRVLFHEFAFNPESSTFGQSGGARVKESVSHHEMKP